jgi:hypothetical protein
MIRLTIGPEKMGPQFTHYERYYFKEEQVVRPDGFAEFLSRQGHHIVKTESCFWYDARPGFYFYFPYHKLITPCAEELRGILWGRRCFGARYFTSMDHVGKESFSIVCSDKNYDITSVDAHYARRQTRRGLENFSIRQIDFKELAKIGISLNNDTLTRQGRDPNTHEEKRWQIYCSAADGLEGFEAWGAFSGDDLASFIVTFQMEDHFTILHHSSATKYLPSYPNNALVFYVTKLKLALPEVDTVSYGPQSLDAPESLEIFKFRMGFQKRPMKQTIVFNPLVKPFINSFSYKAIQGLSTFRPKSDVFRKLEGIVRLYREAT